jgi:hypothetical protein
VRIYWLQGALTVEPENDSERAALRELVGNIKIGLPPEMTTTPGGSLESGSDLFEFIGCHQVERGPLASQPSYQEPVVGVNVGLQVVPKLRSRPSRP